MGYSMRTKAGYPRKNGKSKNGRKKQPYYFRPFSDLPKTEKS
jgi:hypothetical protein